MNAQNAFNTNSEQHFQQGVLSGISIGYHLCQQSSQAGCSIQWHLRWQYPTHTHTSWMFNPDHISSLKTRNSQANPLTTIQRRKIQSPHPADSEQTGQDIINITNNQIKLNFVCSCARFLVTYDRNSRNGLKEDILVGLLILKIEQANIKAMYKKMLHKLNT